MRRSREILLGALGVLLLTACDATVTDPVARPLDGPPLAAVAASGTGIGTEITMVHPELDLCHVPHEEFPLRVGVHVQTVGLEENFSLWGDVEIELRGPLPADDVVYTALSKAEDRDVASVRFIVSTVDDPLADGEYAITARFPGMVIDGGPNAGSYAASEGTAVMRQGPCETRTSVGLFSPPPSPPPSHVSPGATITVMAQTNKVETEAGVHGGEWTLTVTGPGSGGAVAVGPLHATSETSNIVFFEFTAPGPGTYSLIANYLGSVRPTHRGEYEEFLASEGTGTLTVMSPPNEAGPVLFSRAVPALFPGSPYQTCIVGIFPGPHNLPLRHNWKLMPRASGPVDITLRPAAFAVADGEGGALRATVINSAGAIAGTVEIPYPSTQGEAIAGLPLSLQGGTIYDLVLETVGQTPGNIGNHYTIGALQRNVELGWAGPLYYLESPMAHWVFHASAEENLVGLRIEVDAMGGQAQVVRYAVLNADLTPGPVAMTQASIGPNQPVVIQFPGSGAKTYVLRIAADDPQAGITGGHYRMEKTTGSDRGFYASPCPPPPPPPPPPPGPAPEPAHVTGSGHTTFDGNLPAPGRRFAFSALHRGNGTVAGQFQLVAPSGITIHGTVTCAMKVGNVARIGGIVDPTSDPDLSGRQAFFTVVDNGEGVNAPPDRMSRLVIWLGDPAMNAAEFHCDRGVRFDAQGVPRFDGSGAPLALFPIERGNIKIH